MVSKTNAELSAFKSGLNAAKNKPKRRAKTYRMKDPDVQVKQAIGRFQHDHPYVSAATEALVFVPPAAGFIAGIASRFGIRTAGLTNAMQPIPLGGGLYTPAAQIGNIVGDIFRRF